MTTWKNRIEGRGEESPDNLLANPYNFRTHDRYQQDSMQSVMDEVGWVQDVLVNKVTGHVLDGHMRIMLAIRHNEPKVPVTYVRLSPDEEKIVLATFDKIGSMAGIDQELLDQLVEEIQPQGNYLDDLIHMFASKSRDNPFKEEIEEEKIAPELFERQDYLLVAFDNQFDWKAATDLLGIDVTTFKSADGHLSQRGIGRVITGKEFLASVQRIEQRTAQTAESSQSSE
jgi:hypothetical protein